MFFHQEPLEQYNFVMLIRSAIVRTFVVFSLVAGAPGIFGVSSGLLHAEKKVVLRPHYQESAPSKNHFYPHRRIKRPRVALVLSGGGARGVAQIGVMKVLERYKIPVDFIASTSMGAIVGGLFAAGYTITEVESLALHTNWDDVLSLSDETNRTEQFVDQKISGERSFIAIRFQGLEPVIPFAVSSGQRLTDFLSVQTLQALYHADPTFDNLKVPFRAVSTDLISGRKVVLKDGSLAEALRASSTVPLLFNPIEKDGMQLIDGGIVDNVPVDVARSASCDLIIVVNTTSGLRSAEEMKAPWQTADQILGIMMDLMNDLQLQNADVVITPEIGNHLSTNFKGLDTLVVQGERKAEEKIGEILKLYRRKASALLDSADTTKSVTPGSAEKAGGEIPDSVWHIVARPSGSERITMRQIRENLDMIYEVGDYKDVYAEVTSDSGVVHVVYTVIPNPRLTSVQFEGCRLVSVEDLQTVFTPLLGHVLNHRTADGVLENVLRVYRSRGYSLARVDSTVFDERSGVLRVMMNEGVIHSVDVQGGIRTQDTFVLREFPLQVGDVFQIEKAKRGITNINSTTLFEYVYLEVSYPALKPLVTIRLKERPSQLVRLGVRADNERHLQGLLDLRDENLQGTGAELGFTIAGGDRSSDFLLEYKVHRLFNTYLTFGVNGFYRTLNSYLYADGVSTELNHWSRQQIGEYQDVRYGGSVKFGSQLGRLGNATVEFLMQNVRLKSLDRAQSLEERYTLAMIRTGTIVDTKNDYPFPTAGIGLNLSYEFAFEAIGSDIGYNAVEIVWESYSTWGTRLTFHPKLTLGFADKTMPLSQQYRLGGQDSFFGVREDDRRGRQLLLLNLEYRYLLPIRLLFDTYLRGRYDLGTISAVPEDIKFNTLRHGVGLELALHTPVGPAVFGVGKSFYFGRNLPNDPVQQGPFLFYFTIGYHL